MDSHVLCVSQIDIPVTTTGHTRAFPLVTMLKNKGDSTVHNDADRSQQIIAALHKTGALHACSRCGQNQFSVLSESHLTVNAPGNAEPHGRIPLALVICENCGHIAQHSLKVLGLV
jgi:hypothetical protein